MIKQVFGALDKFQIVVFGRGSVASCFSQDFWAMSGLAACVQSQPTGWADTRLAQEGVLCKVGSEGWLLFVLVSVFVLSGHSSCLVATHAHENCGCDWVWRRGPGKLAAFMFLCFSGYAGACRLCC